MFSTNTFTLSSTNGIESNHGSSRDRCVLTCRWGLRSDYSRIFFGNSAHLKKLKHNFKNEKKYILKVDALFTGSKYF